MPYNNGGKKPSNKIVKRKKKKKKGQFIIRSIECAKRDQNVRAASKILANIEVSFKPNHQPPRAPPSFLYTDSSKSLSILLFFGVK